LVVPITFAGTPGKANCFGQSVTALGSQLAGSMPLPQRRDSPALGRCSIIRSNPGTPPRIDFLIQPNRIWTFCSIFRKESLRRFTYTQTKRSFFRNEYPAYVGRVWQKGVNLV